MKPVNIMPWEMPSGCNSYNWLRFPGVEINNYDPTSWTSVRKNIFGIPIKIQNMVSMNVFYGVSILNTANHISLDDHMALAIFDFEPI